MTTATVINPRIIFLIFLSLLYCTQTNAQATDHYKLQNESIEIADTRDNTVHVFIFINSDSDTAEKQKLINCLNTANIDYANFSIHRFFIKPVAICPPNKTLALDGYDELPSSFNIDPFYILVNSAAARYGTLVDKRIAPGNRKNLAFVVNKHAKRSPFVRIADISTLMSLIRKQEDTLDYRSVIQTMQQELNELRSRINAQQKPEHSFKRQLGFSIGAGTFLQQLKKSEYTNIPMHQSYKSLAYSTSISGMYRHYLSDRVFIKGSIDLLYFNADNYSRSVNQLPIAAGYSVIPQNPIESSSNLKAGLSLSAGYRLDQLMNNDRLSLNLDAGIFIGKMISGKSKADFSVRHADGSILYINNFSPYTDRVSVFFMTNPTLEYRLRKHMAVQVGLLGLWGVSKMNPVATYKLVTADGTFNALENATDRILLQNIGFTVGLIYEIR
jgi:hypothetical protein